MTDSIRARSKPLRDLQPGDRICDRCGITHGSRDHRECIDCREIRDDGPRWMACWDGYDKAWEGKQG